MCPCTVGVFDLRPLANPHHTVRAGHSSLSLEASVLAVAECADVCTALLTHHVLNQGDVGAASSRLYLYLLLAWERGAGCLYAPHLL